MSAPAEPPGSPPSPELEPLRYRMRTNKDKTPAAVGVTNGIFAVFAGFGRMLAEMIRQIFR